MTGKLVLENMKHKPMRSLLSILLIGVPVTLIGVGLYTYVQSNFYPSSSGRGLLIDQVSLPPQSYMEDVIYFPIPESGLNGVPLRLLFKVKGLEEPIEVVFEVPRTLGIFEKDEKKS